MSPKPSWLEGKPSLLVKYGEDESIPVYLLKEQAPLTTKAILEKLPLSTTFHHTRWSGREIYSPVEIDTSLSLENETLHTNFGDMTYWQEWDKPEERASEAISIYYGPEIARGPQGLLRVNVFGRVPQTHWEELRDLGERIWKKGSKKIRIVKIDGVSHEE